MRAAVLERNGTLPSDEPTLLIRKLTPQERERAFHRKRADIDAYRRTLQQFEGGFAYAVALQGSSVRRVRWTLNKAAADLDLKLRRAVMPKDTRELIVELV
jgi:hypothetical protein